MLSPPLGGACHLPRHTGSAGSGRGLYLPAPGWTLQGVMGRLFTQGGSRLEGQWGTRPEQPLGPWAWRVRGRNGYHRLARAGAKGGGQPPGTRPLEALQPPVGAERKRWPGPCSPALRSPAPASGSPLGSSWDPRTQTGWRVGRDNVQPGAGPSTSSSSEAASAVSQTPLQLKPLLCGD